MTDNKKLREGSKAHVREELRYDRLVARDIERDIEKYRRSIPSAFRTASREERPRTILAEGDSWFRYVIGRAIPFYIGLDSRNRILNLAAPGDELRDMLSDKQRRRLSRELKRGPSRNRKYDLLLFSGGGNDLLGEGRFYRWLNDFETGMTPQQVLNKRTVRSILDYLTAGFEEVFSIRDNASPRTRVYLHAYDFAQPNGVGVCGRGPWLKPHLDARGVPAAMQAAVVVALLKKFERRLAKLVADHQSATLISTQGTLVAADWANEIHPRNKGFKALAQHFVQQIDTDFS